MTKNEIWQYSATWLELEDVILSEVSQISKREIRDNFAYMQSIKKEIHLHSSCKQTLRHNQ